MSCPITQVKFDKAGNVTWKSGGEYGMPIVNLQLSEGGAPCIYGNESFNNIIKSKFKFALFSDDYYGPGCEEVVFPNQGSSEGNDTDSTTTFYVSETYHQVLSFPKISEFQLL